MEGSWWRKYREGIVVHVQWWMFGEGAIRTMNGMFMTAGN